MAEITGHAFNYIVCGLLGEQLCRKCAVRFSPIRARVLLFNTTSKHFRAGLVMGKGLIKMDNAPESGLLAQTTLNQLSAIESAPRTVF
jgi:hypothetical protein